MCRSSVLVHKTEKRRGKAVGGGGGGGGGEGKACEQGFTVQKEDVAKYTMEL